MTSALGSEELASLATSSTAVRVSLHVLAASIWVGGMITVAGLLPTLRGLGQDAPRKIARAFSRLQWPAYVVVVLTGIWNVQADHPSTQGHAWNIVLGVKIAVVLVAGLAAYAHQRSRTRAGLAAFGGVAGVASLAALVLGVFLAG